VHLRHVVALALAAALAIAAAACVTAPTPGPTSTGPTAAATPPPATGVPGGDARTPAAAPGTFETAWGRAWDGLPAGFPVPASAEPAEPGDPAEGPVSGAFVVTGSPDEVVRAVENALAAAGYSTEALDGPLEDGGYVLDSLGADPACRVQTHVRTLGATTMMSVLYGAACPWG
jgi:hypothetical protein